MRKTKRREALKEYGIFEYPICDCGQEMTFNRENKSFTVKSISFHFYCTECKKRETIIYDIDLKEHSHKLRKKAQKFADSNRIERKVRREDDRLSNALEEYSKELVSALKEYDISKYVKVHSTDNAGAVGLFHMSDAHFNELVSMMNNEYDFTVASKRLYDFVSKAIVYFKAMGVRNVLMASTGDMMNSDRRLDELLSQATNRSNATILSVHLIKQVIMHLNEHFNISYACVSGNESRMGKEIGWRDIIATDNYDFTIFNMLKYLFVGSAIDFIVGDPTELVVNLAGQNVLLMHGHGKQVKSKARESIAQIKGKYADKGMIIHYVIFGHVHEAMLGDGFSRSSSLVGDNDYSFKALQLSGRASQNIHLFYDNGNRDSIKIDLQNVGDKGYDIIEELEAYNAKSADKLRDRKIVFEVQI